MADDDQPIATDQDAALQAQQEQQFRAARVRAQQRQRTAKQSNEQLKAVEGLASKLGPEGIAVAVILRFIREHPVISAIILTVVVGLVFVIVAALVAILYYAFHPCDLNKLPLPAFIKFLNTLTHIQCIGQK